MALLLTEDDVRKLLTMPLVIEAVEHAFQRLADGTAILHPRRRIELPAKAFLHYMAAADTVGDYAGVKIYTSVGGALRFLVLIYRGSTGELLALIEGNYLGQMRTGAASGVATRWMAREDARTVGIIGTGLQARTQLEAITAVRKIERIRVFGRSAERRARFALEMTERLGVPVLVAESAEAAVREADIVVTATTASRPVVEGKWLAPGTHINAVGANFPQKRELDESAVRRAGLIVSDCRQQSRMESGDLIQTLGEDESRWAAVRELSEIVSGNLPGRTERRQITLFKSNGIAIEDVATGGLLFELATQRQLGRHVAMWADPA